MISFNQEINSNQRILYDYPDTTIYLSQYEKTLANGGYIKIPFINSKSVVEPNITHIPSQNKYKTSNLYIYRNIDFMKDRIYDGLLIIEHDAITNSMNKFYSVFLLKTADKTKITGDTDIDKIIKGSLRNSISQIMDTPETVNLNKYLSGMTQCYIHNNSTIMVIDQPILVASRFDAFSDDIYNMVIPAFRVDEYSLCPFSKRTATTQNNIVEEGLRNIKEKNIQWKNFQGKNIERVDDKTTVKLTDGKTTMILPDDNWQLDCSPIGASAETKPMSVVLVDNAAKVLPNTGVSQMLSIIMSFIVMVFVVGIAVLVVPILYKNSVVSFIEIAEVTNKPGNLRSFDLFVLAMLLGFAIHMIIQGMKNKFYSEMGTGTFFLLLILISTFVLYLKKNSDAKAFAFDNPNADFKFDIVGELFGFLFGSFENFGKVIKFLLIYLAFAYLLFFGLYSMSYFDRKSKANNKKIYNSLNYLAPWGMVPMLFIGYALSKPYTKVGGP